MKQLFLVILMLSLAKLVNAQTEKVWSDDEVGEIKHHVTYTKEYKHLVSEGVITEVPEFSAFRRLIKKGHDAKLTGDFTLSTLSSDAKMDQHVYSDTTLIVHVVDIGEHWGYFGEDNLTIPIYEVGTNKIVSSFEGDYQSMVYLNEDGEEKTTDDYLDEVYESGYNQRAEEEASENEEKSSVNNYYGCSSYVPFYGYQNYYNPYSYGNYYGGSYYGWGLTLSVGSYYGGYPCYAGGYGSGLFSSSRPTGQWIYGRYVTYPRGVDYLTDQGSYGNLYYGQLQAFPRGVSANGQGYQPRSGSGNTASVGQPRSSSGNASAGQPRSVSKSEKFQSIDINQSDMDRWNRAKETQARSAVANTGRRSGSQASQGSRTSQNRTSNVSRDAQRKPSSASVSRTSTNSRNVQHQARQTNRPASNARPANTRASRPQASRPAQARPQQQARPAVAQQRPPQRGNNGGAARAQSSRQPAPPQQRRGR